MKRKLRSIPALTLTLFLFFFHSFGFGGFERHETTSPDYGISTLATFPDGHVIPQDN